LIQEGFFLDWFFDPLSLFLVVSSSFLSNQLSLTFPHSKISQKYKNFVVPMSLSLLDLCVISLFI
jgi:hypothetical protein